MVLKLFSLILVIFESWVFADHPTGNRLYYGSFSNVATAGEECSTIFESKHYFLRTFFVGPTKRTIVLHFRGHKDTDFFDLQSLVGLFDDYRFRASKTILKFELLYRTFADGILDENFIYLKLDISAWVEEGAVGLCLGSADFTGFAVN